MSRRGAATSAINYCLATLHCIPLSPLSSDICIYTMDPLSVAASLAGLITISTQIVIIIKGIKSKNKKELDSLSREVHAVRTILTQIQQIVQFQSAKPAKNSEWLDALSATLDDCGDTYLQLQKSLQGLVSSSRLEELKKKVKWTLKEKDLQDSLRKIESYKLSLDLLLSVQTRYVILMSDMEFINEKQKYDNDQY